MRHMKGDLLVAVYNVQKCSVQKSRTTSLRDCSGLKVTSILNEEVMYIVIWLGYLMDSKKGIVIFYKTELVDQNLI